MKMLSHSFAIFFQNISDRSHFAKNKKIHRDIAVSVSCEESHE